MGRSHKKPSGGRAAIKGDEADSLEQPCCPSSNVQPDIGGPQAAEASFGAKRSRTGRASTERTEVARGIREERARRTHKDPFKKLRGLADSVDHSELYRAFTAPGPASTRTGFFQGLPVDLAGRFESETLVCRSLDSCISTMECCGPLVFVALKEDAEPFNVFQFAGGRSVLAVFDRDLNQVDALFFELGTVVQIEVSSRADTYRCTALFHGGTLASFEYAPGCADGSAQPRSFSLIESDAGVIRFHSCGGVLVYTDGFRITKVDGSGKTSSKRFKVLIIDLVITRHGGDEFIYFLDRNGRHLFCRSDFTGFGEMGVFIGFTRLLVLEEHGLLISTDEFTYKKFFIAPFTDKQHKKACRYYLRTWDGAVTVYRLLNRQNVSRRLLQIVPRSEGVLFCTSKAEFDLFEDTRCHVNALCVFEDCFFLTTETGLLVKVLFD